MKTIKPPRYAIDRSGKLGQWGGNESGFPVAKTRQLDATAFIVRKSCIRNVGEQPVAKVKSGWPGFAHVGSQLIRWCRTATGEATFSVRRNYQPFGNTRGKIHPSLHNSM